MYNVLFSSGNKPKDVRADSPTQHKNWAPRCFSRHAGQAQGQLQHAIQTQC